MKNLKRLSIFLLIGATSMSAYAKNEIHYNVMNSFSDYAQANIEDPIVKFYLGTQYYNDEKFEKSFGWFLSSAEDGMPQAIQNVAVMVEKGIGIPKSWDKAFNAYKVAAVKGNNPYSQMYLGEVYRKGEKVKKDLKEALKYYELASNNEEPTGAYYSGKMYLYGLGTKRNVIKALENLTKNIDAGHSKSIYEIANIYKKGIDTPVDNDKALQLYIKAANLGNDKAMFQAGKMFMRGIGTPIDYKEGLKLLQQASEKGNKDANYFLGLIAEIGLGVKKNISLAKKYYTMSARDGNTDAMLKLSEIYRKEKDQVSYIRYLEMAANAGNKTAQRSLAYIYREGGSGLEKNKEQYVYWMRRSSMNQNREVGDDFFDDNPPEVSYREALIKRNNEIAKALMSKMKKEKMSISKRHKETKIKNIPTIRGVNKK